MAEDVEKEEESGAGDTMGDGVDTLLDNAEATVFRDVVRCSCAPERNSRHWDDEEEEVKGV